MSSKAPVLSNPRSFWQKAAEGHDLLPLFILTVVKPLLVWLIICQYLAMDNYPDLFWLLLASVVTASTLLVIVLTGLGWLFIQIDESE